MKKLFLFCVLLFASIASAQVVDSTNDTGSVVVTPPKPADTSVMLTDERFNVMLRRGAGGNLRVTIGGNAVDTTRLWKRSTGRVSLNGKTYTIDSVQILVKLVVNKVYYH